MTYTPASYTPGSTQTLAREQIAHLQEASLAIARSLDSDEVLGQIVRAARALLGADAAVLFGLERGRADLPLLASDGLPPDHAHSLWAEPFEAAVGKAVKERHVVGVEDLSAAPADLRRSHGFAGREGFSSVLAAPLAAQNTLLGVLALYGRERRPWTNEDATLLALFASHAALAVQNARLYARLNRRASDLQALFEISHLLSSFVERDALLDAVIARLVGLVGAKYGAVMAVERGDEGQAELKIRAHYGLTAEYVARANGPGEIPLDPRHPKGNGPASVSVREGRPAAIGDVFVDERFAPFRAHALSAGYLAVASVPLCAQGHVRGCLTLYYARRREFRQSELDLVSAVADGVALALERMDLSERLVANAVANRSFEEADRLKGEFISTVSHELRTPLTIIKGYTDLLVTEQAGSLNETQQKFLLGVQRNTVRLTDLVSDLLDVSRLDGGQLEMERRPLDVGRIVAESVAEYERVAAERGVALSYAGCADAGAPLPPVTGDAGRIAQVVNNLLSNAVKYSPPGGTVYLTCAPGDTGKDEVVISVRDHGPGIPADAQDRLFTKFYRVDSSSTRQVGGTGLGLAIAKAIVEQHGGRIWVDSAPGAGSTFSFALPVAAGVGGTAAAAPAGAAAVADRERK